MREKFKNILKNFIKCLKICLVSVFIINILRPLFCKNVDDDYQEVVKNTEYESDEVSTEKILCIDDNEEALLWRLRMINSAKEKIVLSTFDFRTDNSGTDVCAALYEAAERGVKIQLLIDGIYVPVSLTGNDVFDALISHENIEAKFYNPISMKHLCDLNYRMHDKYLIIDESMYLLGGRNTSDIFLGDYKKTTNVDREILVYETEEGKGESLHQLQEYFTEMWNESCTENKTATLSEKNRIAYAQIFRERYESLKEKYGDFTAYNDWLEDTFYANKITLLTDETGDFNKEPRVFYAIAQLAKTGRDVFIQTPYIIANYVMYDALEEIAQTADLKIMINAVEKGSNPWGCTDYLNNKARILKTGADVYEVMNEQAVHTKTVLIDDNISIVGSFNLDMRSTYLDTETMLVIDSEELNAYLREMTDEYAKKSKLTTSDGEETVGEKFVTKEMPLKKKIIYGFLRIIVIPFRYLL